MRPRHERQLGSYPAPLQSWRHIRLPDGKWKKGWGTGFSQANGWEGGQFPSWAKQPREQPIGNNQWTICGPGGRRQHLIEAIHLPGAYSSTPARGPGLLALVQKCGRWHLLTASGQQSVVRIKGVTCACWGWCSQRSHPFLPFADQPGTIHKAVLDGGCCPYLPSMMRMEDIFS